MVRYGVKAKQTYCNGADTTQKFIWCNGATYKCWNDYWKMTKWCLLLDETFWQQGPIFIPKYVGCCAFTIWVVLHWMHNEYITTKNHTITLNWRTPPLLIWFPTFLVNLTYTNTNAKTRGELAPFYDLLNLFVYWYFWYGNTL